MSCEFAYLDGSYVLGALAPTDRQEFERHLAGCPECAQSVREFAGLPGLLARVDVAVLDAASEPEPVPETLLPALVREVRRTQRCRSLATAGLAAAVVLTVAGAAVALVNAGDNPAAPISTIAGAPAGAAMAPVQQDRMTARLAVESVLWGTKLDLTCTYAAGQEYREPTPTTYAMVVHTRDGRTEQVATWTALPGKTMRLAAATAIRRRDIDSVEVRTTGGTVVLRTTNASGV